MGRFDRSMALARMSGSVLAQHRSLVALPAISLVASVAVLAAAGFPLVTEGYRTTGQLVIVGAIAMIVIGLVQAYFHAAITIGAVDHFEGRVPTIGTTTNRATAMLPALVGWALLSWLVSAIAAVVRDRIPLVGPILAGLGQAVWGVVTFLSMPAMVIEGLGPVDAVRRSGSLLRRSWGENILGQLGIGFFGFLLMLPAALVTAVAFAIGFVVGIATAGVTFLAVIAYVTALDAVYRVAMFRWLTEQGKPAEFGGADFATAFTAKKSRFF